jgi:diaminopimelate epimerase
VAADLGAPILASADIPIRLDPPQPTVVRHRLWAAGRELVITATSMGNPHCALFMDEPPSDALVAELGAALERHPAFPRRTNVEFIQVQGPDALRVRFWERGVGPTSASGTGAASAAVAAVLEERTGRRVRVVCDGGELDVAWPEGGTLTQTGDVEILYEGDWLAG